MIPEFPEFAAISAENKISIQDYTGLFDPYSDFNFFSLWAWDTDESRRVSKLNKNLVVLITDYGTNEPILTFLGGNEAENTAFKLLEYAVKNNITPELRYVPETSIKGINESSLKIEEERGDFDYIYSVSEIIGLKGIKYKSKRQLLNTFTSKYPKATYRQLDIIDPEAKSVIQKVSSTWINNSNNSQDDINQEMQAIDRIVKTSEKGELIVSIVEVDDLPVAFSVDEILPGNNALSHFSKADISIKGAHDFLNVQTAHYLQTQGVLHWNWEQDLNIPGLRDSKLKYRPVNFIKKYNISI
jgi:hypothetical protein